MIEHFETKMNLAFQIFRGISGTEMQEFCNMYPCTLCILYFAWGNIAIDEELIVVDSMPVRKSDQNECEIQAEGKRRKSHNKRQH